MKESEVYINFFRRNIWIILLPLVTGLILSTIFYALAPEKARLEQVFRIEYQVENADVKIALADQAVAETRAQKFNQAFPETKAIIYKSAPLLIAIEVDSPSREDAYDVMLRINDYLDKNFNVAEAAPLVVSAVQPLGLKFLLSGILGGFLAGFAIALFLEYRKNY